MYSWIAISDVHLGWKLFNLPELAKDLLDNFVRVCDEAVTRKVDYLFIVGDLYDTNKPSPDLIKLVQTQVKRLNANGVVVAGIAGDHDKPINDAAWVHLTGIIPITEAGPEFIGFDYNDCSQENVEKLHQLSAETKEEIEWIFLHGQALELFPYCQEKKKLDFKQIDLIAEFPRLRGVVLGDIHKPLEGTIADPKGQRKEEPYIGYCGSLGIIKTDEVGEKEGLLWFDGKTLSRLPFEQDRMFIRLSLAEEIGSPINWIGKYQRFFKDWKKKTPVFLIEHDRETKHFLSEISALYEVGIVKVIQGKKMHSKTKDETINIRSELKTSDRIEETLRLCAPEKEVYDLTIAILKDEDARMALDKFKKETFK